MFTPVETTIGAVLLHKATSNLLYQNGNILGLSGFLGRLVTAPSVEILAFFTGMAASYPLLSSLVPEVVTRYPSMPITLQTILFTTSVAALIGWSTKASNGCTSGHMLCGLSRLSGRSTVATATFFTVALITHHLVHPSLYTEACPGDVPCYTPVFPSPPTTLALGLLTSSAILAAQTIPHFIAEATSSHAANTKTSSDPQDAARTATQFFSGLLFALGLQISGMAHPAKVTSFLSFPVIHAWDPSLALVVLFGVLPNIVSIQRKGFAKPPAFAKMFELPTKTIKDVDVKFVAGAAAFGVGWGLTGTCPGPAVLRAFAQPVWGVLWLGGFWVGRRVGGA
ncbi:YeeE/YedE family integral membrane protein-like protein [Macroventuria anomochaeta]|uniref:YeeE/YedE family integral membrane protein-like protein n=1 Tax=Macroventuria anomochaeta TaxID=301207 RepID=A0ACB6S8C0_9PLEO|nr:YeeE/YedE family integral membrane protein-like protein [Macroventuria anomochaeta]KAF2629594.1 YeeE/YedE family integral membrane protein-like protein [Macroventuria anomochaeta]